jgi:hypothetical protein
MISWGDTRDDIMVFTRDDKKKNWGDNFGMITRVITWYDTIELYQDM